MPIVRECLSGQKRMQGTWQAVPGACLETPAGEGLAEDQRHISLDRKIKALRLTHAAGVVPGNQASANDPGLDTYTLGEYRIVTQKHEYLLPVIYRFNILTQSDHPLLHGAQYLLYGADVAEESREAWGSPVRYHGLEWVNPFPDDDVLTIEVRGEIRLIKIEMMIQE